MHFPVMCAAALDYLALRPDGVYLDATAGLGGHTAAIAERLTTGLVIACDRDAESLEMARQNTAGWAARIRYHQARFSELGSALAGWGAGKVNGLLADLGSSRYQLTEADRGFSLMADGPLDMRMDRSQGLTAAEIVNTTAEKALADLLYELGQERRARKIARAIVRARPIRSTLHLARAVEQVAPRTGRLHPATQTFMALRIAVNEEQQELDRSARAGSRTRPSRRAHRHHLVHVIGRPKSKTEFSESGPARPGENPDQARGQAHAGGSTNESGVAQRQAAGA